MKIIAIFILSITLRLFHLGLVPVALSHDETDNIIQAHSVIQTGHDIEGSWSPWSLLPNSGVMAELSPLINTIALSAMPQSLFSSRLTTAILSSLFPILIWWWLTILKVNQKVALSASFLLAISPWHLVFSRTALEQPTSLFFYMLSWISLAYLFQVKKSLSHYILSSIFFLFSYGIGYFTYHGYKFSFPILTTIYLGWLYLEGRNQRLAKFGFGIFVVVSLVMRTVIYSEYYGSRSGEIITSDESKFVTQVNEERRQSVAPSPVKAIFSNKPIAIISTIRDKYVDAISPQLLFLKGESNGAFSVWQRGYFYLFTLPLMIIGLVSLLRFRTRESYLFTLLLLVSPIATIVHVNNSLAFRSAIYFVILNIILAYGLTHFLDLVKRILPKSYSSIQTGIYLLFSLGLINFCYSLYYITPLTNSSDYFFHDRVLANYVRLNPDKKLLLVVTQPRYIYSGIILSSGRVDRDAMTTFNSSYSPSDSSTYHTDRLDIIQSCSKIDLSLYDTIIVEKNLQETSLRECLGLTKLNENIEDAKPHSIVSPKDSGERYRIYSDTLCQDVLLDKYVQPLGLSDFSLEEMDKNRFCSKWIVSQ